MAANSTELSAYWMPFTANRAFKANPRLLVAAQGMYYRSDDDRQILDATAGLWCVNAGHGRTEISEAARRQLETLDFAPQFQMAHPDAFRLAHRVASLAPDGLDHVFFTNSGSESVDTALKIARAYHRATGEAGRTKFIGRARGYHGVNIGGTSVGGIVGNREAFGPLLGEVDHLPHTHDLSANAFSRGQPLHGAGHADALEALVALHGRTIAAVIVEPIAGSTGVLVPPIGYLQRLRAICDKHGILLIFDEVITGFGRVGGWFASSVLGVTPDIITCAKGLTNGAAPMGAVIVTSGIHDSIVDAAPAGTIELPHGYTYSAHPLSTAIALATLDIHAREGLAQRAESMAPAFEDMLHDLADCPGVVDIRNFGLMGAVELDDPKRAWAAFLSAYDFGLLIRVTGGTIAMSPPLIIEESQIARIGEVLRRVIV